MDYKRIELELRCIVCNDLFQYPVMLPCGHNICAGCTEKCLSSGTDATVNASSASSGSSRSGGRMLQESLEKLHGDVLLMSMGGGGGHGGGGGVVSGGTDKDSLLPVMESDQISMVSDADSGVVCGSSASNSSGKRDSVLSGSDRGGLYSLTCPHARCRKVFITDDAPGKSFPANRLMMKILSKYTSVLLSGSSGSNSPAVTPTTVGPGLPPVCQLCESDTVKAAVVFCQQCEIFYCSSCRDSFHPQRGPLTTHKLIAPDKCTEHFTGQQQKDSQQQLLHNTYVCAALEQQKCPLHNHEYTMYCSPCRLPLCWRCLEKDTFHQEQHDVQSLQGLSKSKKAEFSRALQALSEKSKRMTEWISRIKATSNHIPEVERDIEANIMAQCDHLIQLIHNQKSRMIKRLRQHKEQKISESRENATDCTALLQQATGQIQFGIEVLKETEAVNFLQFSAPLYHRVAETSTSLDHELTQTWIPELNLRFDSRPIAQLIENLELHHVDPPGAPRLNITDCRIINGKISLYWDSTDSRNSDFYVLEVAESGGPFARAYTGPEMKCCLNFNSHTMIYQARLKAVNIAGESPYSNIITLHVEGGSFTWDPIGASRDLVIGNDGLTLTSTASEDFVCLASAGFVRGVHYWEINIDRYDNHPDPAFGIATAGVKRDSMLGKDSNGWAVYIDAARSWCLHNNQHVNRTEGGIAADCTVGVLLDLDQRQLSFFVNDEPQAPVPAFQNLPEGLVYYPAVSINRNVQATIRPCLQPPSLTSSPEC